MLKFYTRFEINDLSGEPLSESDMTLAHYNSITSLQVNALTIGFDFENTSLLFLFF